MTLALPLLTLALASAAWNAYEVPVADDFWHALMCVPEGLVVYIQEYGLYRILTALVLAPLNSLVLAIDAPLWLLSLVAWCGGSGALAMASSRCGLSSHRCWLLFALLTSSPFLLETTSFWSATMVQTLAALTIAAYMIALGRATTWDGWTPKIAVVAAGLVFGLLVYEPVLPFIVAASAVLGQHRKQRVLLFTGSLLGLLVLVALLHSTSLYNPFRWRIMANGVTDPDGVLAANIREWQRRVAIYVPVIFSIMATALKTWAPWILLLGFLSWRLPRRDGELGRAGLDRSERFRSMLVPTAFGFSVLAGLGYLFVARSANIRYLGLVAIFGYAVLVWIRTAWAWRLAVVTLFAQTLFLSGFPVHFQDAVQQVIDGAVPTTPISVASSGVLAVEGRLSLRRWGTRGTEPERVEDSVVMLREMKGEYLRVCTEQ